MKSYLKKLKSEQIPIIEINEFVIIDTKQIGNEIGLQFLNKEEIWQSDMMYEIMLYLNDIQNTIFDSAVETLKINGKEIDVEK